jgi:pyrroline-5-carboxylate reductase
VVLWRSEGSSPRELREMVTSKGGTTAAAVQVLEEGRVGTTFQDAIRAAYHRSRELNAPSPLPRE